MLPVIKHDIFCVQNCRNFAYHQLNLWCDFILQTTSWWHHSIKDGWSLLHTGLTRGQHWGHIGRLSATSLLSAGKEFVFSIFQGLSLSLWGLFLYFFLFTETEEPRDIWGSIRWECMPRCSNIDLFEASSYYTYKLCNNYCTMPDAWKLKCFRLYDIILVHTYFAG